MCEVCHRAPNLTKASCHDHAPGRVPRGADARPFLSLLTDHNMEYSDFERVSQLTKLPTRILFGRRKTQ